MAVVPYASIIGDPAWVTAIITAIGVVVGAVVAILVARWQRGPKAIWALGYVPSASRLVRGRAPADRLKISYTDPAGGSERQLDDAALVTIRVLNSGNQPIPPELFHGKPLVVPFGTGAQVVGDVTVRAKEPAGLEPEVEPLGGGRTGEAARLEISPLLLNPGAWFELEVLVDCLDGPVRVLGNVENVGEIEKVSLESERPRPEATGSGRRLGSRSLHLQGSLPDLASSSLSQGCTP